MTFLRLIHLHGIINRMRINWLTKKKRMILRRFQRIIRTGGGAKRVTWHQTVFFLRGKDERRKEEHGRRGGGGRDGERDNRRADRWMDDGMALLYVLEMSTAKVLEVEALQEDCTRFKWAHILDVVGGVFVNRNDVRDREIYFRITYLYPPLSKPSPRIPVQCNGTFRSLGTFPDLAKWRENLNRLNRSLAHS